MRAAHPALDSLILKDVELTGASSADGVFDLTVGVAETKSHENTVALDQLEPLLEVPIYLSPGWLSIDPLSDPLRDHPRFQALLEKYDTN